MILDTIKRAMGIAPPDPVQPPKEVCDAYHRLLDETSILRGHRHFIENSPDVFDAFVRGMREGMGIKKDGPH